MIKDYYFLLPEAFRNNAQKTSNLKEMTKLIDSLEGNETLFNRALFFVRPLNNLPLLHEIGKEYIKITSIENIIRLTDWIDFQHYDYLFLLRQQGLLSKRLNKKMLKYESDSDLAVILNIIARDNVTALNNYISIGGEISQSYKVEGWDLNLIDFAIYKNSFSCAAVLETQGLITQFESLATFPLSIPSEFTISVLNSSRYLNEFWGNDLDINDKHVLARYNNDLKFIPENNRAHFIITSLCSRLYKKFTSIKEWHSFLSIPSVNQCLLDAFTVDEEKELLLINDKSLHAVKLSLLMLIIDETVGQDDSLLTRSILHWLHLPISDITINHITSILIDNGSEGDIFVTAAPIEREIKNIAIEFKEDSIGFYLGNYSMINDIPSPLEMAPKDIEIDFDMGVLDDLNVVNYYED